ncbi:hypothetical protein QFZ81_005300 [Paenibacillus sp. V4I9]|uniref:S-layer homology domain-containing protein n=1 Tax=Paenibacillus sp. V4I9 TaxID=3042308 RepID=UPI002782E136|nr:S-layer homology domain-containing protein [Paenibacillus sp. V4I9]MDQ0890212.1 hypothetical protein [Paenibacillus sp. V4I9]
MLRKLLTMNLALTICILLLPISAWAASQASYTLTISNDKPEVGHEVQIIVKGQHLEDVYAYEVNLDYDPSQLKFKDAKSAIKGFSIPPIVKNNRIQFANTKIGKESGEGGDVTLCTLTFTVIGKGQAIVKLTDVKLVSSSMVSTKQNAGVQIAAEIHGDLAPFSDIYGHWARESIDKAAKLGFVSGYEDGTFHPQGLVTRAEFAAMLAKALHLPINGNGQLAFADLEQIPDWARSSISAVTTADIVTGYEDHTFRANQMISRAEITTMIVRALGTNVNSASVSTFADVDQIPDWAQAFVSTAAGLGIIQGKGDNLFVPNENATRAEAVTIILSMLAQKH